MTSELLPALERLAGFLRAWGQPAAVIGGMAMIARVRARPTRDVDLLIVVPAGSENGLLALARAHGFSYDEAETRDFLPGGLVRLWAGPVPGAAVGVDLLFADDPFSEGVTARAAPARLGELELPVATVEDLLLMKLEANRPIDLDDAIAIKDAHGPALDRAYLDEHAEQLGVAERLRVLLDPG